MSTAEVEAALMLHPAVSEAAAVSRPHKVKGECLYCFVTLKDSRGFDSELVEELKRLGEEPPLVLCDFYFRLYVSDNFLTSKSLIGG